MIRTWQTHCRRSLAPGALLALLASIGRSATAGEADILVVGIPE
jgi:hypothetical protein